jgi:ribosomal protein L37AE/L43A
MSPHARQTAKRKAEPKDETHSFHLCPLCGRATPASAKERFCLNDGTKLLRACPQCGAAVLSPYSHFCAQCGHGFAAGTLAPSGTRPEIAEKESS